MLLAVGVQALAAIFQKGLAESIDTPEWSAEVLRHRIAEGLELAIRRGQLRSELLQFLAALAEFLRASLNTRFEGIMRLRDTGGHRVERPRKPAGFVVCGRHVDAARVVSRRDRVGGIRHLLDGCGDPGADEPDR